MALAAAAPRGGNKGVRVALLLAVAAVVRGDLGRDPAEGYVPPGPEAPGSAPPPSPNLDVLGSSGGSIGDNDEEELIAKCS